MSHRASHVLAFVGILASGLPAHGQPAAASVEESGSGAERLGYKIAAAALDGLKAMPGVSITVAQPDGWTIAVEPGTKAIWLFAPAGHYAYPSVVRREIKQRDGNVFVEMVALCQAEKEPCDTLIREFQLLNQRMSESIRSRKSSQK